MKNITKLSLLIFCLLLPHALFASSEDDSGMCPVCGSDPCVCNNPPDDDNNGNGNQDNNGNQDGNDDGNSGTDDGNNGNDDGYNGNDDGYGGNNDETGSSTPNGGTDPCAGINPFTLDGNAKREVTDLSMTGSDPLSWIRYNNSMPRMIVPSFGQGASWRHNWQYELQSVSNEKGEYLQFIYPSGIRRTFDRQADGSFTTLRERYMEEARLVGKRVEITTPEEDTLVFEPVSVSTTQVAPGIYRVVTLTNKDGVVTRFDYDDNGLLRHITNDAGNQITLYYKEHAGQPCISRVETSDGRAVDYEYEIKAGPSLGSQQREYATLTRARYGDGTSAEYNYAFVTGGLAPLLVEADDPRYNGRATHIGYRYNTTRQYGTINEEFNPITGQSYATLKFDPKDPAKRIVNYTDDRAITYRVPASTNGRPTAHIDSLGRKSTWSYGNAGVESLEAETLTDGKSFKYTRDNKGKLTRSERSDGLVVDTEYDKNGKVAKTQDNRGHSAEYVRNSKGRVIQVSKTKTVANNKNSNPGNGNVNPNSTTNNGNPNSNNGNSGNGNGNANAKSNNGNPNSNNANPNSTTNNGNPDSNNGVGPQVAPGQAKKEAFAYDDSGRLLRADYDDGTYEEFTRDAKGNITIKRNRKGEIHRYTYAQRGLIASETDPTGATTRYTYDQYGQLASRTDALGHTTTWERTERGLVTKQVNPDGTARQYFYDKYGRKTGETDAIGRSASTDYDNLGRPISQTDFAGRVTRYDYTETPGGCGSCSLISKPTRITHPDGRIDEFLYDSEGRMLMRSAAIGTAQMATTLYAYDDANNIIQQTNPDGGVIRHTYDIDKRRLSTTDTLGRTTSWTYDADGNILSITDPSGRITDRAYDADNNLIYTVTPDGAETTYEYDAARRRTRATNALGYTTRWNYDATGSLLSKTDSAGDETHYAYDDAGRRTRADFPDGTSQTLTYTPTGKPSQVTTPDGSTIEYEYDDMGRIISRTATSEQTSPTTTRYTYDAAGRCTSMTDALGRTTSYEYNTRNQVTTTTHPDGTQTHKEYDITGRVTADISQLGHATHYTYTALGDIASVTDANDNTYTYAYDEMRRRTSMVYPDGSNEQWTYDLLGRLATYTNRAGQTKTITYNTDGQPVSETWLPAGIAPNVYYTYDANGRRASAGNGNALITYAYDQAGRMISETTDMRAIAPNMAPQTVHYKYDALGRQSGLVYPDGTSVTNTYDSRNRVTAIADQNGRVLATYTYDANGRRSTLTRDIGITTHYNYDAAGQLLKIAHQGRAGSTLASASYEYDDMGRRITMTRDDRQTDTYYYDDAGQVTGIDYGDLEDPTQIVRQEAFSYDALGNRVEHIDTGANQQPLVEQYETNNLNQYTRITSSLPTDSALDDASLTDDQDESNNASQDPQTTNPTVNRKLKTVNLSYDSKGNLLSDGKQWYAYDAQNRLTEVRTLTDSAQFYYDASNRCILRVYARLGANGWETDEKTSVAMIYDRSWSLLADYDMKGSLLRNYVHGTKTDEVIRAGGLYPLTDALGSVIGAASEMGGLESSYTYEAFGKLSSTATASSDYRFLFAGRERLAQFGLSEMRNRYYSFALGRFINADPNGFNGGINLYAYCYNNPTNKIDPFGLDDMSDMEAFVGTITFQYVNEDLAWRAYYATRDGYYDEIVWPYREDDTLAAAAVIGGIGLAITSPFWLPELAAGGAIYGAVAAIGSLLTEMCADFYAATGILVTGEMAAQFMGGFLDGLSGSSDMAGVDSPAALAGTLAGLGIYQGVSQLVDFISQIAAIANSLSSPNPSNPNSPNNTPNPNNPNPPAPQPTNPETSGTSGCP